MDQLDTLSRRIVFASFLSVMLGTVGMTLSFLFLSSPIPANVFAGAPAFVAGAVMIGSGLIAGALLVRQAEQAPHVES